MNNRRERLHRALDCVLDMTKRKKTGDAWTTCKKCGVHNSVDERDRLRGWTCGGCGAYTDGTVHKPGKAKDALDDRQFLDLMETVGRLRDSTRSLKWPGDDNPKVQQASTDAYNATMSKVKALIASSGVSPQEFKKRGTKVATKVGRRINLTWVDSLDRH